MSVKSIDLEFKSQKNTATYLAISGLLGTLVSSGTWTINATFILLDAIIRKIKPDAHDLFGICTHDNINEWSVFKPNKQSPYDIDDFLGYNHDAFPPLYWDDRDRAQTVHVEVGDTWNTNLGVSKGDMLPTSNLNGFSPIYMQTDDGLGNDLVAVQREVDGIDFGSLVEWGNIVSMAVVGDDTAGDIIISLEYWSRTTSAHSWVKRTDEIEDGNYTITVIVDPFAFDLQSAVLQNNYKAFFGGGDYTSVSDFDIDYDLKNINQGTETRTIYWSVWNAGVERITGSFSTGAITSGNSAIGTVNVGSFNCYLDNPSGGDPQSGYASMTFYADAARTAVLGTSDSYQVERNPL